MLWCPERRTGVLPSILKTLQEVQGGIKSKNGRLSSMDNFWQQTLQALPPNVSVETEALSMLAHSNEDLESNQQEGTITDFKPLSQANDLPIRFLNPKLEQAHNNQANGKNVPQIGGVTAFWASPRFGHPHSHIPCVLGIPGGGCPKR